MGLLIDSFWRAAAYCLHPKVILGSLLPLLIAGGLVFFTGRWFWEDAVDGVRATLEQWSLVATFLQWLESIGAASFRAVLAPVIVVALAVPVIVVLSLMLVALLMTPALVRLVAARRFPRLQRRQGAGWWQSAAWSLGCTVVAMTALAISVPFWLIPPLVLVLPPLIWGWLTYKALAFDVLADHASADERRRLMVELRWPLLGMGIVCGYLGAAPSVVWALGALAVVLAPVLVVVSVWLYTLVFAFSSLWFAHYLLTCLQRLRDAEHADVVIDAEPPTPRDLRNAALPPP